MNKVIARRQFLGLILKQRVCYYATTLKLCQRIGYCSYSKSEKDSVKRNYEMKQDLDFGQFKNVKLRSFAEFQKLPSVKALFNDDMEKISKAYEDYCICKFNRYRLAEYGDNPGTMI